MILQKLLQHGDDTLALRRRLLPVGLQPVPANGFVVGAGGFLFGRVTDDSGDFVCREDAHGADAVISIGDPQLIGTIGLGSDGAGQVFAGCHGQCVGKENLAPKQQTDGDNGFHTGNLHCGELF